MEILLFSEYIEHCIRTGEPFDDYSLSKQLGITQTKVRSLKERKELKYPKAGFDWRESFAESIPFAKYDKNDHYVKMIIQDVNVLMKVRHFIEEKGWYNECSLNRKLLRIPLACFVEICADKNSLSEVFSEETKEKVKEISKKDSSVKENVKEFLADFSKDGLKSFLMSASKETILSVLPLLPFGGMAKTIFGFLGKMIQGG